MFTYFIKKIKRNKQLKKDAKIALATGRAEGYQEATSSQVKGLKDLQQRLEKISLEVTKSETSLRENFNARIRDIEKDHEAKCSICATSMAAEKSKLIEMQKELSEAIFEFDNYVRVLQSFTGNLEITFESILKGSSKITNSISELAQIHKEIKTFTKEKQHLLDFHVESIK